MGKAITEPLFIILITLIIILVILYHAKRLQRPLSRTGHGIFLALAGSIIVLWALSTHVAESWLINQLSSWHPPPTEQDIASLDIVVVLSGGHVSASDPMYDQLDASSAARVLQGVRAYKQSDARFIIMSGYALQPDIHRMVHLMRDFAVDLGVPPDRIILEPDATNTREHPIYIGRLVAGSNEEALIQHDDILGVVTSSWHLPRAVIEFENHFPNIVPIPAFHVPVNQRKGLHAWMPRARSLAHTTTAIAEYIGMIWYQNPLLRDPS